MNSKITIEIDFENNNQPIIQILQKNSDDVRDKLIKSFTEQFGGSSSWCKIQWKDSSLVSDMPNAFQRIAITPLKAEDFEKEAGSMLEQSRLNKEFYKQ